jgi:sarcosine oxidase, subunit beta
VNETDVVVIGGGLLGCALAWMLSRDGVQVDLFERDQLNAHASGQNAGSLHFQLEYRMVEQGIESARRAAQAMPLHLQAAALWASLSEQFGPSLGVVQSGGLMLAETPRQTALLEAKSELERSWGLDVQVLSGSDVRRLAPYLSPSVVAAAYCPLEGKANTRTAGPILARAALARGARIHPLTEVTAIESAAGRWRIRTAAPPGADEAAQAWTEAGAVVLAAGVWTTRLGRLLGVDLPTIPVALTMTVTAGTGSFLPHLVQHAGRKLSLKQTAEGNVLIGGGWPARLPADESGMPMLDARPQLIRRSIAANQRAAMAAVPRLAGLPVLRTWAGTTTITRDQLPLVGAVPQRPGVFVATGGSAFTLGPSFAQVLSEMIRSVPPSLDLSAYDPARFGYHTYA